MDGQRETHESYGMLQISRSQYGGAVSLFGSSIKHSNVIRLRVSTGEVSRSLNSDFYLASPMTKDTFVEVEMSYSQFAEAITSLNMGSGVPVTIRQQGEHRFERPPFVDKETQFKTEYMDKAENLLSSVQHGMEIVDGLLAQKKPLNKADKEEISSVLGNTLRVLTDSMPFLQKRFMEQMEKTSQEAKAEVEAFVQNKLNQIAIAAIGENQNLLSEYHEEYLKLDQSADGYDEEQDCFEEELEETDEPNQGISFGMEMR